MIRQWRPAWPPCLEKLLAVFKEKQGETAGIKDFILVLMLYRDHSPEEIEAVVELALENSISNSEGVRHMLIYSGPEEHFAPLSGWPTTLLSDVAIYGELGVVR